MSISRKFGEVTKTKNENFTAILLLHNLLSYTHPPLLSARRFLNAVRQCYFEMKTNKELYFSILSSIILCLPSLLTFLAGALYGQKWRGIKSYKTSMFSLRIAQAWSSIVNSEWLGELQVLGDWELRLWGFFTSVKISSPHFKIVRVNFFKYLGSDGSAKTRREDSLTSQPTNLALMI